MNYFNFKYLKIYFSIILILIVFFSNFCFASITTTSTINSESLDINSEACILIDEDNDKILYEKNAYAKMYPASTTKVMTAILTTEKCNNLDSIATVSYYAVHSVPYSYSIANLQVGEKITIRNLLNVLMIASANDAAFVLAQYISNNCTNDYPTDESQTSKDSFTSSIASFADLMNAKATEIGTQNTHFVNPNGIHSDDHYSTAYDLALLCKYARKIPLLVSTVATFSCSLPSSNVYDGEERTFNTTNLLLHRARSGYYQYATGFKTGYTDAAQYCIIATATKNDRNLIVVVLHSDNTTDFNTSRESDCKKLFEYGFNKYSYKTLIAENSLVTSTKIFNGSSETKNLNLVAKNELKALLKNDTIIDISPKITIHIALAPITKGTILGTATYTIDGKTYTTDLVAQNDVYASNYLTIIWILLGIFAILLFIVTHKELKRSKKLHRHN